MARGDNIVKEMEAKVKKLESEKKELDKQVRAVLISKPLNPGFRHSADPQRSESCDPSLIFH